MDRFQSQIPEERRRAIVRRAIQQHQGNHRGATARYKYAKDSVFFDRTPEAVEAFEEIIKPQAEDKIESASFDEIMQMIQEVNALDEGEESMLAQALIVHKPINLETQKFFDQIKELFGDWLQSLLKNGMSSSSGDSNDNSDGQKQYNFNFS